MPRYIGRHPTEPERDSVDNLKDVDITTTSPSATDNLLVYDNATGVYKPGNAAGAGGGGGNLSAPTDNDNFDDGALLGSDSTLAITKFYNKSSGAYQATDPGGGNGIAVTITLDGSADTGFKATDDLTESVDKINEMMLNIKNNHFVRHAKFVPKNSSASTATVTGQANIGDTIYFHIPKELFDSTDGNVTRCDVLDWGDGTAAENNKSMSDVSGGNGAKYVSHQYNDAVASGSGYTVKIRLYNHNAIDGTIGSSICFQLTDLLTSYTTKPAPALEYQFTNRAGTQTTYTTTSPVNIDEDDPTGANAGKTILISFRVKDALTATPFSHFAMRFTSGSNVSYYPTALNNAQWNYTDNTGSQISNNWEPVTTSTSTPYRHDFTHRLDFNGTAKKDEEYTVDIKTFSNTADPNDAVGVENGLLVMRLFKDYADELTYSLTGYKAGTSGNNNEAGDNQTWASGGGSNGIGSGTASDYNYEGYVIESSVATLDSGANIDFVTTYGTKIQFNYGDAQNNWSSLTKDFNTLNAVSHIIILRKTTNSGADESRSVAAQIVSSHSLSPFNAKAGDTAFTIQNDPRASFSAVSNPAPEFSSGANDKQGFLFTTYTSASLKNFDFSSSSENTSTYSWDFDNDGTSDSSAENPAGQDPYSTAGQKTVKLIATGTNSEGHHVTVANDDTETKTNYIEIKVDPSTGLDTTLTGKSMTLTSQGNQPKLCSSADDNSAGEASLSAGADVTRRNSATVQATGISDFISAFPGPGNNDMACVVKGYVNGDSTGNEKTFTTSYANFNAGQNTGIVGDLNITDEEDEFTAVIPKGFGRKFKARVQATVSAGINSYKLGHIYGSNAETNSNKLNFVYDDVNTNPTVGGTWTVTQQSAGTPRKVDGISYVKGGGATSVSIASMTVTPVSGQCYYGGSDPITIADATGTALGAQQAKAFGDLSEGGSAVSTPLAKNTNFTNLSFNATLNPSSGGGTNGKLKVRSKNVAGEGGYSNYPGSNNIMWWQEYVPDQSQVSTVAGASEYVAGGVTGTYIRRISSFSSETTDNPSYTATDHFYKDDSWNDNTANSLNQALRVYNATPKWEWNNVDYSTNMIPTGNTDRSSAATNQYLDFCAQVSSFAATNVGIKIEGTNLNNYDSKSYGHKDIWVAIPEVSEATGAAGNSYNGWLTIEKTINTDNGIRDNTVPYNDSEQQVNLNLGTMSGNNSTLRNILFRVKLTTGMTVTSFSLVAYAS